MIETIMKLIRRAECQAGPGTVPIWKVQGILRKHLTKYEDAQNYLNEKCTECLSDIRGCNRESCAIGTVLQIIEGKKE